MQLDIDEPAPTSNRLTRAQGQLGGVVRTIEEATGLQQCPANPGGTLDKKDLGPGAWRAPAAPRARHGPCWPGPNRAGPGASGTYGGTGMRRAPTWFRRHPVLTVVAGLVSVALTVWLVRLVQVQQGVETTRTYWSQPRGEAGGLVYVALGDSAAQGVGASSPEHGYVGRIAELLRQSTGRPVLVHNLSVSGATVADVAEGQLPQLAGLDADLVTVAVGGNDVRGYEAAAFAADVDRLVAGLPAGTFVADVPYFMHGRWETDSAEAAGVIREAVEGADMVLVPLNDALRAEGVRAMLTQTAADAFHPNDRGHAVWARAFWTSITEAGVAG